MKKVNTILMSAAIVLIAAFSFSIGTVAIHSTRNANKKIISPAMRNADSATHLIGIKKYNGEWISVMQLPEVTISEPAVKKSK